MWTRCAAEFPRQCTLLQTACAWTDDQGEIKAAHLLAELLQEQRLAEGLLHLPEVAEHPPRLEGV